MFSVRILVKSADVWPSLGYLTESTELELDLCVLHFLSW